MQVWEEDNRKETHEEWRVVIGVPSFSFLDLRNQVNSYMISGSVQGTLGLPGLGFPWVYAWGGWGEAGKCAEQGCYPGNDALCTGVRGNGAVRGPGGHVQGCSDSPSWCYR